MARCRIAPECPPGRIATAGGYGTGRAVSGSGGGRCHCPSWARLIRPPRDPLATSSSAPPPSAPSPPSSPSVSPLSLVCLLLSIRHPCLASPRSLATDPPLPFPLCSGASEPAASPASEHVAHSRSRSRSDSSPSKVVRNLLLGSGKCAWSLEELNALHVTHIVNAAPQVEPCSHSPTIEYLKVEVLDDPSERICDYFRSVNDFIDKARSQNKRVLVHCHSGASRGAALVLAYLVERERMDLSCAYSLLRKHRVAASPNEGFMQQLYEFEASVLRKSLDRSLLNRGSNTGSNALAEVRAAVSSTGECHPCSVSCADSSEPDDANHHRQQQHQRQQRQRYQVEPSGYANTRRDKLWRHHRAGER